MSFFRNLLPACYGCGKGSSSFICATCDEMLRFKNACARCGRSPLTSKLEFCLRCLKNSPIRFKLHISFKMDGGMEKFIQGLKRKGQFEAWRELRPQHLPRSLNGQSFDGLCFVASDPVSIRERGFDSNYLFGSRIAEFLRIKLYPQSFKRRPFLKRFREMSSLERNRMSSLIFLPWNLPPKGSRILLVDDVLTSGASLTACARILRKAGCHIEAYVLARRLKAL